MFAKRLARRSDEDFTGPSRAARPRNRVMALSVRLPAHRSATGGGFFIFPRRLQGFDAIANLGGLLEVELSGRFAHAFFEVEDEAVALLRSHLLDRIFGLQRHRDI